MPTNPFQEELDRRKNPFQAEIDSRAADPGGFHVFMESLRRNVGDMALAIPSATGDLLAMGAAGAEGLPAGVIPGGRGFEFGQRYREQQNMFPANALRAIPRPRTNEVQAFGESMPAIFPGGDTWRGRYETRLGELDEQEAREAQLHPVASTTGDIAGSIASLLIGKKPLQPTIREVEKRIAGRSVFGAASQIDSGMLRVVDRALSSQMIRRPIRGAGRAAETGLEAAVLEVLNDAENNPILAAGLASGGQMAASGFAQALQSMTKGGVGPTALRFSVAALSTAGLWQMVKSASPGGRDRILESIETGYDKVTYALMLGVLGAFVGGRGRDSKLAEDIPNLVEAFTTVPRGATLEWLSRMVDAPEEEQEQFEGLLDRIQRDPDYEGETDFERDFIAQFMGEILDEDFDESPVKVDGVYRGRIQR